MIGTRIVCLQFVFFALLFGKSSAQNTLADAEKKNGTGPTSDPTNKKAEENPTNTNTPIHPKTTENKNNTSQDTKQTTTNTETSKNTYTQPPCKTTTPDQKKEHCIFSLPTGEGQLQLLAVALIVACFALLLTTIICACQVCHLRGVISSLRPRHDDINPRGVREKSQPAHRDENQADGQPTETCLMLSEVTTAQEQEENKPANKTEEKSEDKSEPAPPVSDPNGDVAPVESQEPDGKSAESVNTEVKEP